MVPRKVVIKLKSLVAYHTGGTLVTSKSPTLVWLFCSSTEQFLYKISCLAKSLFSLIYRSIARLKSDRGNLKSVFTLFVTVYITLYLHRTWSMKNSAFRLAIIQVFAERQSIDLDKICMMKRYLPSVEIVIANSLNLRKLQSKTSLLSSQIDQGSRQDKYYQESTDDQNSPLPERRTQTEYLEWAKKKKTQPPN